jgi:hypothetical protein
MRRVRRSVRLTLCRPVRHYEPRYVSSEADSEAESEVDSEADNEKTVSTSA